MKTIVITGGNGDIAQSIKKELEKEYNILTPGKEELDVTDVKRVNEYFVFACGGRGSALWGKVSQDGRICQSDVGAGASVVGG